VNADGNGCEAGNLKFGADGWYGEAGWVTKHDYEAKGRPGGDQGGD
jgi:hypothetical protein